MALDLLYTEEGQTPLTPDELRGLRLDWVTTRGELNSVERANIETGLQWALARRSPDVLSDTFARQLHRRMFSDVWEWAGTFRVTEKNIGSPVWRLSQDFRQLMGDATYWL